MCERLSELKQAVIAYSSQFDAALLTSEDAALVVREAAAIKHAAATVEALAAVRAAESKAWKTNGRRSAEEHFARTTGTSVTGARETLELGRRLGCQPDIADAARRGELSPTQASAISNAAAADPAASRELIDAARSGGSLADLKSRCADVKAAAVDLEARRKDTHRRRYLRGWTDPDGTWRLSGAGNPEDGAQVMAALAPIADYFFHEARTHNRHEHPDAYRFDALVELASQETTDAGAWAEAPAETHAGAGAETRAPAETDAPAESHASARAEAAAAAAAAAAAETLAGADHARAAGPGEGPGGGKGGAPGREAEAGGDALAAHRSWDAEPPPDGESAGPNAADPLRARRPQRRRRRGAPVKLLVRVDLETLMRGFPVAGETCDLVGYGPISVSAVNDLIRNGDPFVAAILMKGKQLVGVAHHGRHPTAWQRSALEWLYPTCAAEGCPAPALHLQIDHRVDWAATHVTILDWLDALCPHDHDKKTRHNWSLVAGIGKRAFVPPDDPRHPRHHPPPL